MKTHDVVTGGHVVVLPQVWIDAPAQQGEREDEDARGFGCS